MIKLSLNKAAKEAGVAKSTLLDAIRNNRMSAPKNEKGHYEIDPAELFRVFPKTSSTEQAEPKSTSLGNRQEPSGTSGLEVEVKMLREQIDGTNLERERERELMSGQIDDLRAQLERQSADHRQALAVLTDQREKVAEPARKGFFARLMG
jgi:hypothetical protein